MKLKNLMFATMVAFAFASCSSDNDPVVTPEGGNGDASLSLLIASPVATKAVDADGGIKTLEVLIFNGSGVLEKMGALKADGTHQGFTVVGNQFLATCEELSAGTKKVVVLANTPASISSAFVVNTYTYASLIGTKNATLEAPTADAPLMLNSQVYNVTVVAGKHNLIGFTTSEAATITDANVLVSDVVKLYRNVAKVTIGKVIVSTDAYANATFTIESIFVQRGSSKTLIASEGGQWGSVEANEAPYLYGVSFADYTNYVASSDALPPYILDGKTVVAGDFNVEGSYLLSGAQAKIAGTAAGAALDINASCYLYENTSASNHTVISIKGTFTYTDATDARAEDGVVTLENQFYNIPVGGAGADFSAVNGAANFPLNLRASYYGVMRNLLYNIKTVTIKGLGEDNSIDPPTNKAYLDVKVEVVGYGEVNQTPEF